MNVLKIFSISIILIFGCQVLYAQESADSTERLRLVQRVIGYEYYLGDNKLTTSEVDSMFLRHPEIYEIHTSAKNIGFGSPAMLIAGSGLLVYSIIKISGQSKLELSSLRPVGASALLIIGGILTSSKGREKRVKTVEMYNEAMGL